LSCCWVATQKRDVISVREGGQVHSWVAGAESRSQVVAVLLVKAAAKDIVHNDDEEERGEGVSLEDA
jgi:hypothetical protein